MLQKKLKCFKCKEFFSAEYVGCASALVCEECEVVVHNLRGIFHPNLYHEDSKQLDASIDAIFNSRRGVKYVKHNGRYLSSAQRLQAMKNRVNPNNISLIKAGIYQGFTTIAKPSYTSKYCKTKKNLKKVKKVKRKRVAKKRTKVS